MYILVRPTERLIILRSSNLHRPLGLIRSLFPGSQHTLPCRVETVTEVGHRIVMAQIRIRIAQIGQKAGQYPPDVGTSIQVKWEGNAGLLCAHNKITAPHYNLKQLQRLRRHLRPTQYNREKCDW